MSTCNSSNDNFTAKLNNGVATSATTVRHRRNTTHNHGVMHKVRSMDSVSFHGLEFKGSWKKTTPTSVSALQHRRDRLIPHHHNEKASRFSGHYATSAQRCVYETGRNESSIETLIYCIAGLIAFMFGFCFLVSVCFVVHQQLFISSSLHSFFLVILHQREN